jgi:hypothetical protein
MAVILGVILTPVLILVPSAISERATLDIPVGNRRLVAGHQLGGQFPPGVRSFSLGSGWDMLVLRFGDWQYGIALIDPNLW